MRWLLPCLVAATAAHADTLSVTVTTTPAGGNYAPRNVVAIWIEDASGNFVKTIDRWSAVRTVYLLAWRAKAPGNDTDAVSGATRPDHQTALTMTWDMKNRAGLIVPDATYTVRMEVADSDASATTQNNEGTFTFVKSRTAQKQTGLSNGGFNTVTLDFQPSVCGNGIVEGGETCDPMASCPTSCPASSDACIPNVLVGSASTCDALCEPKGITACTPDDGCCPGGCTAADDSDCAAGSGSNGSGSNAVSGSQISGGCAAAGGGSLGIALGLLLVRRRRRT
jgi:hypothetical protein